MEITSVPETEQFHWWRNRREVLRRFYTKYLDVEGIAIIGCDNVPDNAFYKAKDIILQVTSKHLQFRSDLFGARFMLAAPGTCIWELPELWEFHDSPYGHARISQRGIVDFCASVIEWEHTPHSGIYNPTMGILTHELGHAIVPSICRLEPNFENLLNQAYGQAMSLGTWANERSSVHLWEYWAEGVRLWTHDIGTGRRFETENAFIEHDPGLTGILNTWFACRRYTVRILITINLYILEDFYYA